ncbi:MAG: RsmG family class I SAM-dependent methyltransferase, partial [Acidimicrobiales bacterium]
SHAAGFERGWGGDTRRSEAQLCASAQSLRILDLGAGGGLPGLVLAELDQDAEFLLLDSSLRRTDFLSRAVTHLGWSDRVTVLRGRAEDVGHVSGYRQAFDVVVARGFGPPAVTAECACAVLKIGGILVVSEPPSNDLDSGSITTPPVVVGSMDRWQGVSSVGLGLVAGRRITGEFSYQVLHQESVCDPRLPRRVGIPRKRPLF